MTQLLHDPLIRVTLVCLIVSLIVAVSIAIPATIALVVRWLLLLLSDIREIHRDYFRLDKDKYQ